MLREIIALFREQRDVTLSKEALCSRLNISPDVLEQMLQTLLRQGRLVEVSGGCAGCSACPLENYCATTPSVSLPGYALATSTVNPNRNPV